MFKKGDSSLVATVLLLAATIAVGVLVASFSQRSTEKVSEKIADIGTGVECNDIRLSLSYDGTNLAIKNRGTMGVNQIKLRIYSGENINTETLDNFEGGKLLPGSTYIHNNIIAFDRVEAKPIFIDDKEGLIGCKEVVYEA